METLSNSETMAEIIRRYDKTVRGWNAYISSSKNSFYNLVILGPAGAWEIKIDSVFSGNPISRGGKIDVDSAKFLDDRLIFYGFRPIPPEFFGPQNQDSDDDTYNPEENQNKAIELQQFPEPTSSLDGRVLEGPFYVSDRYLVLGDSQKVLDEKLEGEVKRLYHSRYFGYG